MEHNKGNACKFSGVPVGRESTERPTSQRAELVAARRAGSTHEARRCCFQVTRLDCVSGSKHRRKTRRNVLQVAGTSLETKKMRDICASGSVHSRARRCSFHVVHVGCAAVERVVGKPAPFDLLGRLQRSNRKQASAAASRRWSVRVASLTLAGSAEPGMSECSRGSWREARRYFRSRLWRGRSGRCRAFLDLPLMVGVRHVDEATTI